MNPAFLKASAMPDVQSTLDERALPIEQVGIRGVRHPLISVLAFAVCATLAGMQKFAGIAQWAA